jgi:uncharacterized protein (DUF1499 family)
VDGAGGCGHVWFTSGAGVLSARLKRCPNSWNCGH